MAKVKSAVYRLKITLADVKPPIWRRVEVKDCTLEELHLVIQVCMPWENYHMWVFDIDGRQYSDDRAFGPDLDFAPARRTRLSQVVDQGVKKFLYIYDMGDDWRHVVQVEKVLEPEPKVKYPRCVKGSRACPP